MSYANPLHGLDSNGEPVDRSGPSMDLYCTLCDTVHEVTPGEAERIIYALQAELAVSVTEVDARIWAGDDATEHLGCPLLHLSASRDIEQLGEQTDAFVQARKYWEVVRPEGTDRHE